MFIKETNNKVHIQNYVYMQNDIPEIRKIIGYMYLQLKRVYGGRVVMR